MIATLPMYDWPEMRAATDAFWEDMARRMGVSTKLSRLPNYTTAWRDPELLFSQTCGFPYTHAFRGTLNYIATPHYAANGCHGANYCSIVFAREAQPLKAFKGARVAFNTPDSMSGMLAIKLVFGPLAVNGNFFGSAIETGSHLASMAAVRNGSADVCATDAVAVALANRYRPDYLDGLIEIAKSPQVPSLPYVTKVNPEKLQTALKGVFADPDLSEVRAALCLAGVSILDPLAYNRILDLETAMEKSGGLHL